MRSRAFTLIELLVVLAIVALLIAILLPSLSKARASARDTVSKANLKTLGMGHANYIADHQDRIATYTRKSSTRQAQDIIAERSGRTDIQEILYRRPRVRYTHLVLIDYLRTDLPNPMLINPGHRALLEWADDPEAAEREGRLPYQSGTLPSGFDNDEGWAQRGAVQAFAYGTSYQSTTAAWSADRDPTFSPDPANANFYAPPPRRRPISLPRRVTQVAFPAQKVQLFEEFDFVTDRRGIFCLYDEAATNTLQFDSSVRRDRTSNLNPGWAPIKPDSLAFQRYRPLDLFPKWPDGKPGRKHLARHRFTREGLQGLDFGGSEINLPDAARTDPRYPD